MGRHGHGFMMNLYNTVKGIFECPKTSKAVKWTHSCNQNGILEKAAQYLHKDYCSMSLRVPQHWEPMQVALPVSAVPAVQRWIQCCSTNLDFQTIYEEANWYFLLSCNTTSFRSAPCPAQAVLRAACLFTKQEKNLLENLKQTELYILQKSLLIKSKLIQNSRAGVSQAVL